MTASDEKIPQTITIDGKYHKDGWWKITVIDKKIFNLGQDGRIIWTGNLKENVGNISHHYVIFPLYVRFYGKLF